MTPRGSHDPRGGPPNGAQKQKRPSVLSEARPSCALGVFKTLHEAYSSDLGAARGDIGETEHWARARGAAVAFGAAHRSLFVLVFLQPRHLSVLMWSGARPCLGPIRPVCFGGFTEPPERPRTPRVRGDTSNRQKRSVVSLRPSEPLIKNQIATTRACETFARSTKLSHHAET